MSRRSFVCGFVDKRMSFTTLSERQLLYTINPESAELDEIITSAPEFGYP